MIDLDALEAGIAEGEARNFFVAPIVKELIAELRHAREQRRIDNEEAARLYDFARDKGAALERAAVVAWLLRQGGRSAWTLTDDIERGEHRREEER